MNQSPGQSLESTLEALIVPLLDEKGVELVELSITGNARRHVLRLFVDRPDGISIGECAGLSRDLADLLDTHDPINTSYTLEVSSPGLTRPIKTKRDFERALGKAVRVLAVTGHDHTGKLTAVDDTTVTVEVKGESRCIPIEDITKANLHFEI